MEEWSLALRPGVSFCRVDGRSVFLDLAADRYFCLSPAAETAFGKLVAGEPLDAEHRRSLDNLCRTGPLARQGNAPAIAPCPAAEPPASSRLDTDARVRIQDVLRATSCLLAAPLRLRLLGLGRSIERIRRRKQAATGAATDDRQARIAAAFARLRLVAAEQDNCLIRSLAVADRLIGAGARPDLVIAVKLRPFYAHAWVQCDGWLVNDRHEFVRNYTPILIV